MPNINVIRKVLAANTGGGLPFGTIRLAGLPIRLNLKIIRKTS